MKIKKTRKGNYKLTLDRKELQIIETALNYADEDEQYVFAQDKLLAVGETFSTVSGGEYQSAKDNYKSIGKRIWKQISDNLEETT